MHGARRLFLSSVVALLLLLAACSSSAATGEAPDRSEPTTTSVAADQALARDDVACDADGLGSTDTTDFTSAHYVVDGRLGALCFGDDDPTLVAAWNELAAITPPDQLEDLALFGAFTDGGGGDDETLAFVNALDEQGRTFQMSVNVSAFQADRDQASLTMAHEFSHVFTQVPSQLDRSAPDAADCTTYFSGDGCYLPGSLMAEWIAQFWSADELASIDPNAEVTIGDGEPRCRTDAGFFGPYAATTPEEDLAEAFAAYVYRVEGTTPGQQARLDWIDRQRGLSEFRRMAVAAGRGPFDNNFETCGA